MGAKKRFREIEDRLSALETPISSPSELMEHVLVNVLSRLHRATADPKGVPYPVREVRLMGEKGAVLRVTASDGDLYLHTDEEK